MYDRIYVWYNIRMSAISVEMILKSMIVYHDFNHFKRFLILNHFLSYDFDFKSLYV